MRTRLFAALSILASLVTVPAHAETAIKIGYTASTDSNAIFVAQKEGIFKRNGLAVELQLITLNSNLPAALQSDSVQVAGPSTSVVLQAVDGGLDLVAIAGGATTSKQATNYAIVSKTGSGIAKPADFVGKRVGVPGLGATLHILFREWLDERGVDSKTVQFVETPFSQMNDLLKSGTVDAVVSADPMTTRIVQAKTGTLISYFVQDFPEGIPTSIYSTTRRWAVANPDAVIAFRKSIAEAASFVKSNPEAARAAVGEFLKYPPEILSSMYLPPVVADVTAAKVDVWIKMLVRQELLTKKPDPARLIVN
jgi:NitT/TauT family transport system substrate-binding protein